MLTQQQAVIRVVTWSVARRIRA